MYSIGQFSLITNTTKKALRHYDEIGLLKPSRVEDNLYRYYDFSKVDELKTINELKSYGLPLSQIMDLKQQAECFSLNEILTAQLEKISREIEVLSMQKKNIFDKLNHTGPQAGEVSEYPIEPFTFENAPVISINYNSNMENMGEAIGKFYEHIHTCSASIRGDIMISISSKDDNDIFSLDVFAYSDDDEQSGNKPFETVCGINCLHSRYTDFGSRENAYVRLFTFAKENNIKLGDKMVEKFSMFGKNMVVDFFVEIVD